jgi:mRNA interferase RelE/StbE
MLKLSYAKASQKFLKSLPSKQYQQCALKVEDLRRNPLLPGVKKLHGSLYHRCHCGEYRIIFEVQKDILHIVLIEKRNDGRVYKKLNRLS